MIVDLKNCVALHHDLAAKDRGLQIWMLDPILIPALSELRKAAGR